MSNFQVKKRMTITDVAEIIGISAKTIMRWEKMGKIRKPKRDWRGWRVYDEGDLDQIRNFHEAVFEVE
jgi:DNA-binding transcriptional MerR regulator